MRKKKRWMLPVIAGFLSLYLVTMGLSTYLVSDRYREAFAGVYQAKQAGAEQLLQNYQEQLLEADREFRDGFGRYLLGTLLNSGSRYQQFSAALYDEEGKKITKTQSSLGILYGYSYEGHYEPFCWPVSDYLTEEETEQLAEYMDLYYECSRKNQKVYEGTSAPKELQEYRFTLYLTSGTRRPFALVVQKIRWEQEGQAIMDPLTGNPHSQTIYGSGTEPGAVYQETEGEIVWQWGDPDAYDGRTVSSLNPGDGLPYIWDGRKAWASWEENLYLQTLPETVQTITANAYAETRQIPEGVQDQRETLIPFVKEAEEGYSIVLRMDSHPWLAALEAMKYVYLFCLVLTVICIGKIIHVTNKIYDRQAALEETRRDFTNAMAHELKTPLGIIRGFAENLLEGIQEEKKEYYLQQIIRQTEEMDTLAREMITLSRLDQEQVVLEREAVSFGELIQKELERVQPLLEEKKLQVVCQVEEAFVLEGDLGYLAKAVQNLLSNAVSYNVPEGRIEIRVSDGCCTFENTAFPLSEEQLTHAFEMFYQGEESRKGGHMGLGLYLAGRILELHGLLAKIENTEQGVKVTICSYHKRY